MESKDALKFQVSESNAKACHSFASGVGGHEMNNLVLHQSKAFPVPDESKAI